MAEPLADKAGNDRDPLSPRDRAICDAFLSGTSRKELAAQHGITLARIGQILNAPHAVAYLLQRGNHTKAHLFARVGAEILSRTEWGGVRLADLLAVWKAAMPQEVTVNTPDLRTHAERVAEELGLDADARARLIDYAAEKKQRRAS
jgi:DNA-binding CsgD family transcriptional regulator